MSHGLPRISIIPAAAVTDPALEGRDLQLLALFGRHTDRRGWCCRSQVKMARELGCGRATVQRSIIRLVDAGYLQHRPIVRESGADAAHEYRVVLDVPDEQPEKSPAGVAEAVEGVQDAEMGGARPWAGVPTLDGQGVPMYEWAPMLTFPVKRTERERAREDDQEFELARRSWPSGFADSREDALAAWQALSQEDRRDAASEIGRFVETNKAIGRKLICGFASYLREQRWKALPDRPTPARAVATEPRPAPRSRPTAFQRANPHLYPELFGGNNQPAGGEAAKP